ncbi:hypothetical protein O181_054876, partial [Austropuccinia psidii MF-1]|nr:hypothetical protein [Austropuccinia psidii MF-1]
LEKTTLDEETTKVRQLNQQAKTRLNYIEAMYQKLSNKRAENEEINSKTAQQRLLQQQAIETENLKLLQETEKKLKKMRDEIAQEEKKHQAKLALWHEREKRTLKIEKEAEARARARQAEEDARAIKRAQELDQERLQVLEKLKKDAIQEYRKAHDEIRREQEQQLKKDVEEAKKKIAEESAIKKASLEAEREQTLSKLRLEAKLEYQKQLDQQIQYGKETTQAFKEVTAKAAEQFKLQSQEAIKNLYNVASEHRPASVQSTSYQISSNKNHSPLPPSCLSPASQADIRKRRDAQLENLMSNLKLYNPDPNFRSSQWVRSAPPPHRVIGYPGKQIWGSPNRQRANSVGQTNLRTPFISGSAIQPFSNSHIINPSRNLPGPVSLQPLNSYGSSRPVNPQSDWNLGNSSKPLTPRPSSQISQPIQIDSFDTWNSTQEPVDNANPDSFTTWNSTQEPAKNSNPDSFNTWNSTQEPVKNSNPKSNSNSKHPTPQKLKQTQHEVKIEDPDFYVVSLTSVEGFHVVKTFGEALGVALREIPDLPRSQEMTMEEQQLMRDSAMNARRLAVNMMIQDAKDLGANCVIGLTFHSNIVSNNYSEMMALGTAVLLMRNDKSAVFPNSVEHATRTALENQASNGRGLPLNGATKGQKGGGGEGENQKKKKNKGKQVDEGPKENQSDPWGWGLDTNDNNASNNKNNQDNSKAQNGDWVSNKGGKQKQAKNSKKQETSDCWTKTTEENDQTNTGWGPSELNQNVDETNSWGNEWPAQNDSNACQSSSQSNDDSHNNKKGHGKAANKANKQNKNHGNSYNMIGGPNESNFSSDSSNWSNQPTDQYQNSSTSNYQPNSNPYWPQPAPGPRTIEPDYYPTYPPPMMYYQTHHQRFEPPYPFPPSCGPSYLSPTVYHHHPFNYGRAPYPYPPLQPPRLPHPGSGVNGQDHYNQINGHQKQDGLGSNQAGRGTYSGDFNDRQQFSNQFNSTWSSGNGFNQPNQTNNPSNRQKNQNNNHNFGKSNASTGNPMSNNLNDFNQSSCRDQDNWSRGNDNGNGGNVGNEGLRGGKQMNGKGKQVDKNTKRTVEPISKGKQKNCKKNVPSPESDTNEDDEAGLFGALEGFFS